MFCQNLSLSDLIWKIELQSNKLETPEEIMVRKRLEEKTTQIVDPRVRKYYQMSSKIGFGISSGILALVRSQDVIERSG